MPETSFADDLKHMVRHTADRVQNGLQPALGNLRALPKATKIKIGACAAAIVLFVGGIALRGNNPAPVVDAPPVRTSDVRPAPAETRQAARNYAVAKAEQANGSYRAAAENYANAAREARGDDPREEVRGPLGGRRRAGHPARQEGQAGAQEARSREVQGRAAQPGHLLLQQPPRCPEGPGAPGPRLSNFGDTIRNWPCQPGAAVLEAVLARVAYRVTGSSRRYFQPGNGQSGLPVCSSFGQTVTNLPFWICSTSIWCLFWFV